MFVLRRGPHDCSLRCRFGTVGGNRPATARNDAASSDGRRDDDGGVSVLGGIDSARKVREKLVGALVHGHSGVSSVRLVDGFLRVSVDGQD